MKLSKADFGRRYWEDQLSTVPEIVGQEYYEHYVRSALTFDQYLEATTGTIVSSETGEAYTFKDKDLPKSEAEFRDDVRGLKDLNEGQEQDVGLV